MHVLARSSGLRRSLAKQTRSHAHQLSLPCSRSLCLSSLLRTHPVSAHPAQILGFAYKKDTSDTRESPALHVCRRLLDEGAELAVYDPQVPRLVIERALNSGNLTMQDVADERSTPSTPLGGPAPVQSWESAGPAVKLSVEASAYAACAGAHAFVVLTDWDEFKRLDFAKVRDSMKRPCFAFDARCILDAPHLRALGFTVHSIGSNAPPRELAPRAPPAEPVSAADIKRALNVPGPLDY